MAITWGSAVSSASGNGMRLGWEFSQSPSTVGSGTSSVVVTLKLYIGTRYSVYDSSNAWSLSGSFSGSGSVNINHGSSSSWSSSNITLITTKTRTVSPSYAATIASSFSATITGVAAVPGTAKASGSWNTGKRPISGPAAPSAAKVTRTSDTQQNVSWTNTSPTSASNPYQNLQVERWDAWGNAWKLIATVGVVTSYTDTSTKANNQYRYRVRAKNSAGTSGYSYTNYMSTTPSAPGTPRATKTAAGDIVLTWSNTAPRVTGIEVWVTENGVDKSTVYLMLNGSPTTWTHSNPNAASTWSYRLKTQAGAATVDDAPNLYSAFSGRSNTVQLLTNPLAPSRLLPTSQTLDATDPIKATWTHNDVDGTDQTAFEIQYRQNGGAWTNIGKKTSTASTWTFPANTFLNGKTVEWQVRTYGGYATAPAYSPWSGTAAFITSSRPTVVILSPEQDEVVGVSRLSVSWSYYDDEDNVQVNWRATLLDADGTAVSIRTGSNADTSMVFPVPLVDASAYVVRVEVRDTTGLWSEPAETPFTVEYALPPVPEFTLSYDREGGYVTITITNPPETETEVPVLYSTVSRSFDGISWVTVADNVEPDTTVADFIPGLNMVNYYRVTAVSALPSMVDSPAQQVATVDTWHWVWINVGPGFGTVVKIRDNAKLGVQSGRAKTLHGFAGRTKPVEFAGEQRNRVLTLAARFAPESSTPEQFEAAADMGGVACVREPGGRRYFVSLGDPNISYERVTAELALTLTEVDFSE